MKKFKVLIMAFTVISLVGCVSTAMEGANMAKDKTVRSNNMDAANAGDAEAQFKVGSSYCCSPKNTTHGVYDNNKATEYLCMAARQGYAPAANKIGDIYSGDTVSGLRILRRVANAAAADKLDNKIIAYYWYQQAALGKDEDATKTLKKLDKQDTSAFTSQATTPCTLKEVYGDQESQSK